MRRTLLLLSCTPVLFLFRSSSEPSAPPESEAHTRDPRQWMAAVQRELALDAATSTEGPRLRHEALGVGLQVTPDGASLYDEDGVVLAGLQTVRTWQGSGGPSLPTARPSAGRGGGGREIVSDHGELQAWWRHAPDGIEQGWTVPAPLGAGPLHIEVEVTQAEVRVVDGRLYLGEPGSGAVGDGVAAWDAAARPLDVVVTQTEEGFELVVDVDEAAWPVTVDPVWAPWGWQKAGTTSANYGQGVALDGDVNGDGYSDALIGAPGYDGAQNNLGRVYLYLGGPNGLATAAAQTWTGRQAGEQLGASITFLGDVNGDGYEDAAFGADGYDSGNRTDRGAVYIHLGNGQGLSANPQLRLVGPSRKEHFGGVVAAAGDVDGDGYDDLLVGTNQMSEVRRNAWLYLGGAQGIRSTPLRTYTQGDNFGLVLGGIGDVNGDGFDDIALQHQDPHDPQTVMVYYGRPAGPRAQPDRTITAWAPGGRFAGADINQDGFSDLIRAGEETITVRFGSPTGLPADSDQVLPGFKPDSMTAVGDMTGDGFPDVLMAGGARVMLIAGSSTGLQSTQTQLWEDVTVAISAGAALSVGDVDGDQIDDGLLGAAEIRDSADRAWGANALPRGWSLLLPGAPESLSPHFVSTPPTGATLLAGGPVGDFDGDGLLDVPANAGSVMQVYPGTPTGPDAANPYEVAVGAYTQGFSAGCADDITGDGWSDLLLFGPEGGRTRDLHLMTGGAGGLAGPSTALISGRSMEKLTCVGDVDGDGDGDFVVHSAAPNSGRELWLGGAVPTATGVTSFLEAKAGADLNGDGRAEIVGCADVGVHSLKVWFGRPGGPRSAADQVFALPIDAECTTIQPVGDTNADGLPDVAVTIVSASGQRHGKVYIYLGSPQGLVTTPAVTWDPLEDGTTVEAALVAGVGDVDGDGYGDVATVAAPVGDAMLTPSLFTVWRGGPAGPAQRAWWRAPAGIRPELIVAPGDLDADGYADMVILRGGSWWGDVTGYTLHGGATGMSGW